MSDQSPHIIAHRGFWTSREVPQNSIAALRQAGDLPIFGTECDLRMTRDEKPVLHHDAKYNGHPILRTDYRDLAGHGLPNGEPLPLLSDYLEEGKKSPRITMILEIKKLTTSAQERRIVERVLSLVGEAKMESRVEYISFSLFICRYLKKQQPLIHVKYLNGDLPPGDIKALGMDGLSYEYPILQQHPEWIEEAKEIGLSVGTWTVNDAAIFRELTAKKVDYITTDYPDKFGAMKA